MPRYSHKAFLTRHLNVIKYPTRIRPGCWYLRKTRCHIYGTIKLSELYLNHENRWKFLYRLV